MKEGFNLLELGSFDKAEVFFLDFLKDNPGNKTAQICYARAVGLSGEPKKATQLFKELLQSYPNDFEVRINYNESFLWAKQYLTAKPLYAKMVEDYPTNFAAVLGYANTLSNLKEYNSALKWVEKALELDSNNRSAMTTRKYIRLGYANQFINEQSYIRGEQLLQEVFTDFPEDKDALLNLANLYLIIKEVEKAKNTYKRFATTSKDSITALNGIALAEHLDENNKEALITAKKAKKNVIRFKDVELIEQTYDRYTQALIWNAKYKKAKYLIDSLENHNPNRNWIFSLKATLGLYTGRAKTAIKNYEAILQKDSASFDGNLGKANALFAADKIVPAYQAAFKTLEVYENQKDALSFVEKLNSSYTPYIEEHAGFTFDNGNNKAFFSNTNINLSLSTRFKTTISYLYRTTENTVTGNKANSHVLLAGMEYKFFPKTVLKTVLGLNNSQFIEDAYTQPVLDIQFLLQPFALQNLSLSYQREVQNFNADLIEREIVQNHYGFTYNLGTTFDLGWYTQLMYTEQSDANIRKLMFSSLYYKLLKKPNLKIGINYQYLSFKEQVPDIYFSPEKYQAFEFFADIRGNISEKTTYMLSAATGFQKVEQDSKTAIFRSEAGVQYQFSKRFSTNIYGKYSNIASATAVGFEFTEIGIKLKWLLTKKPLFYKKLRQ